ncbi:MAG: hypothetical protein V7L13_27135 [Nostoc sp.]
MGLAGANRLLAECEKADRQSSLGTYIDLNEHITNIDGNLKF